MEDEQVEVAQTIDLTTMPVVEHRFDHIVGTELRCSIHDTCVVIRVKPTEVLEKGVDGELHLVDKMATA